MIYGVKLTFHDPKARAAFVADYGSDINGVLARPDLDVLGVDLDGMATIQLQGFQLGGVPRELADIVLGSSCSIGDLQACHDTLRALATYAQTFSSERGAHPDPV